jgi:glycosyltransferase involved in cell wall biosynthesis
MADVYVDLTGLVDRKCTGIERYAKMLYDGLKKKFINKNIFYLTLNDDNSSNAYILGKNLGRLITEYIYLPFFIFIKKPGVIIFPVFPPSRLCWVLKSKETEIIPVIHDVVPWKYEYTMSFLARCLLIPRFNTCLKRAKRIITVSKTECKSLKEYSNAEIIVIYPSILDSVLNKKSDIIERLGLKSEKFLLTVSTIEPRKNFAYLLKVLALIGLKKYDLSIVIVGRIGWGKDASILKKSINNNLDVVMTGYISNDDLSVLYQRSLLYITLPIHEGFGFTPVEALLNNTPVIVSDIPIFHEILNIGAHFVTVSDINSTVREIEKIISDANNEKIDKEYKKYYSIFKEEEIDKLIPDNLFD